VRIGVLTSLYPTPARPFEGIFAERRWSRMVARGHAVRVVHGLPWASRLVGPRAWREIASAAQREVRANVSVERPRYLHVPGRARANARRFAARCTQPLLEGEPPEVVVADYAWPAAMAVERVRSAGIPFVIHGRGSDVLQVSGEAGLAAELASALQSAGHWCAVSADLVARMDELGGREGWGMLTPNGIDLEVFALRDRAAERARLGITSDAPIVLVVGHLIERKDPLLALRTFKAWSGARADCALVFIGRGPLEDAVLAEAGRLGLVRQVRILGELPPTELARWYAAADALLLTSRREGRPNVVLEALACGLPVLATDAGGTRELLGALPGSLCAERDPHHLAKALANLLAERPARETLRQVAAPWTWDAGLDALERCLERAVSAQGVR
jgi:glycosyltransferase involved in cell wall biosynthesis